MKKVIVTGSSGFIGRKLKEKLIHKNYQVIEINTEIGNIADKKIFENIEIKSIVHVFHLAAKTFVPDSWSNPFEFYSINSMGTLNVLEFCRKSNINLTFISTYLYGQPEKLPISEIDRKQPNNPYAHSKYLAEEFCEFYCREFGVQVSIIRPFNVFGIGQKDNFLIPSIIKQALYDEQIKVKDLIPKRDYIYIDDLIEAILLTQECKNKYSVYNIGSGYSKSVKQIIDMIQNILKINKPVSSENIVRINEINDVVADISKAKDELNWIPKYSIEQGLQIMIEDERRKKNGNKEYTD